MTKEEKYDQLSKVFEDTFWFSINMSDTFGYACADVENIVPDDLVKILPIYKKYGHTALIAYASINREGVLPLSQLQTKDFFSALKELKPMAESGEILFEQWLEKQPETVKRRLAGLV